MVSGTAANFLYRFDIYVSLGDRTGKPVDRAKIRGLKNEILEKFGGLTMTFNLWESCV